MKKLVFVILLVFVSFSFAGDSVPKSWKVGGKLEKVLESRELVLASEVIEGFESNAVVVLMYFKRKQRTTNVSWLRAAFAIGDGSLLVTAAHCVDDFVEDESQAISREIFVVSPYYGDVFGVEVVAVDEKADVAILRAGWQGHPGLELAAEKDLADGGELAAAGYKPPYIANSRGEVITIKKRDFKLPRRVTSEKLPFKLVSGQGENKKITLTGTRFVGPGWSGSPMILPKTGKVGGVVCNLSMARSEKSLKFLGIPIFSKKFISKRNASGCSVGSIRALIEKQGLQKAAYGEPGEYKAVEDSVEAFSGVLEYIEACTLKDLETAFEVGKKLVRLRKNSARMHLLLAEAGQYHYFKDSTKKELPAVIDESYKTALQLDPNCATGHATYASFLSFQKRYDEALAETEKALAIDEDNQLALVERMRMLMKEDIGEAEKLAVRLTEAYPKTAHYWYSYSSILRSLERYEEGLAAAKKAVELRPGGLYSGQVGSLCEDLGRYDEAEKSFKKMSAECGCQKCLWEYGRFLVRHRPEKLEEAEKALNAAEKKKGRRVSQEILNYTRLSMLEKTSAEEAEAFCRKLLDEDPNDGSYWFRMAGILRTQKKHDEALEAIRKAVEICPERNYDARLANILGKTGRLDEAEKVYDRMLEEHSERQKYWYWYAEFLADYFPERKEDARKAISQALVNDKKWRANGKDLKELCVKLSVEFDNDE